MMSAKPPSDDFEEAVKNFSRSAIGATLVVLPVVVGSFLGVADSVMFGYLCILVIVLSMVVIRRRR